MAFETDGVIRQCDAEAEAEGTPRLTLRRLLGEYAAIIDRQTPEIAALREQLRQAKEGAETWKQTCEHHQGIAQSMGHEVEMWQARAEQAEERAREFESACHREQQLTDRKMREVREWCERAEKAEALLAKVYAEVRTLMAWMDYEKQSQNEKPVHFRRYTFHEESGIWDSLHTLEAALAAYEAGPGVMPGVMPGPEGPEQA